MHGNAYAGKAKKEEHRTIELLVAANKYIKSKITKRYRSSLALTKLRRVFVVVEKDT